MSSLVRPAYIRIGVLFKNEDDPISQFARESLTREACTNGYRPCIQRAQDLFEDWMNSDDPLQYQGSVPQVFNCWPIVTLDVDRYFIKLE